MTIGGMDFIIHPTDEAFDVEIPEINAVYTHMLGHDCHSIVAGAGHADGIIAQLKEYQTKGFDLILTSHYTPEDLKDAQTKIDYLEDLKVIAATLMNIRPAELPLDQDFLTVQDAFLSAEREAKGVVDADVLPDLPGHPGISLWQGDMTRLKADAIVNAANRALLGCFHPCHGCIDNAIHSAAGRYAHFLQSHTTGRVLFLELGVGYNTPGVIKYPFWRRTRENPDALYVCVNRGEALVPPQLGGQAIAIDGDIAQVVRQLLV